LPKRARKTVSVGRALEESRTVQQEELERLTAIRAERTKAKNEAKEVKYRHTEEMEKIKLRQLELQLQLQPQPLLPSRLLPPPAPRASASGIDAPHGHVQLQQAMLLLEQNPQMLQQLLQFAAKQH